MVKVVIIGAGINGLACAIKIQEHYKNSEVVVLSREFSPNTTGDGSGGLWYPYLCGTTSQRLLNKWGSATYNFLYELWFQGGYDICAIPIYYFFPETSGQVKPEWAESVLGYEALNERHLEYYNQLHNSKYGGGIRFTTFVLHPASFLKYLKERFERANGKVIFGDVTSLHDPLLEEYDVVVNCAGLGARHLVPDNRVYPIRGQVTKFWYTQCCSKKKKLRVHALNQCFSKGGSQRLRVQSES
ncbi:unnamed protein product [Diatraea saccharalis]|uniref:FAD dependent oxidoreductase domain-containing protein n=1 Tax=Diatraea saccharalis TaxID=40085 RepID=A0A9N9R6T0_9NEOP|nr:unnamed protein product [Diatraea saccharalis]